MIQVLCVYTVSLIEHILIDALVDVLCVGQ